MSENDFYCTDCNSILTETSHLIDKSGGCAYFVCGKCGSEFTMVFTFKKEPNLKKHIVLESIINVHTSVELKDVAEEKEIKNKRK